jgi:Tol biopolymer transport system component
MDAHHEFRYAPLMATRERHDNPFQLIHSYNSLKHHMIRYLCLSFLILSLCACTPGSTELPPTPPSVQLVVTATAQPVTPVRVTVISTVTSTPRPTFTPKPILPASLSANQRSANPSISADGRYVVFESDASNLVPGDTNNFCSTSNNVQTGGNCSDIFLYDRLSDSITLISKAPDGTPAQSASILPTITADGRYIAFSSFAPNLIENEIVTCDLSGTLRLCLNVYLYDRESGQTELISRSFDGGYSNGFAASSSISDDGRYIVFTSFADNLVPDDTNTNCEPNVQNMSGENCMDVFLYERETQTIQMISVTAEGTQGNGESMQAVISGDGSAVAFISEATNFAANDGNESYDVFMWRRLDNSLTPISVGLDSNLGNNASTLPSISTDGNSIGFTSLATNLIRSDLNEHCDEENLGEWANCADVFVWDGETNTIERVSVRSGGAQLFSASTFASVSADGQQILFLSYTPLITEEDSWRDWDIFLHNRSTRETVGISTGLEGREDAHANSGTGMYYDIEVPNYDMSADGRFIVFGSLVDTFIERDTNTSCDTDGDFRREENCMDVFLLDRQTGTITLISRADPTIERVIN